MGLEHRKFIRVTDAGPVKFTTPDGKTGEGKLIDISLGGARFASRETFKIGQLMEITFTLGTTAPYKFTAWIKHKKTEEDQFYYGLEFALGDQRDLHEYIRLNDYIWKTPEPTKE